MSKFINKLKQTKPGFMAPQYEHIFYSLFFLGQNLLWGFAGNTLTFLSGTLGDVALASAVLIAPKIWDAINDTLFGYIVDKVSFKNGREKFLPWIRIGVSGIGIFTIFMFAIPVGLSTIGKIIWFLAGYILFDLLYTLLDAPAFALPTVLTSDNKERTTLLSGNKLWSMVGGTVASVGTMFLLDYIGWFWGAVIFCALGVIMMIPLIVCAKERLNEKEANSKNKDSKNNKVQKEERYTLKQMFKYLGKNKYLLITLISFFIFGMCSVETALSVIIAQSVLGQTIYGTVVAAMVSVSVITVSAVIPRLIKKFDKFYIMVSGILIGTLFSIISYFVGYSSVILAAVFMGLKCISLATWQCIIYMLIADTTEYGRFKSGTKATGITFALQTTVSKGKAALLQSFAGFGLALVGYDAARVASEIPQEEIVKNRMWAFYIFLPCVGYLLALGILVLFYKLRDKDVQAMTRYNNNEIGYNECMEILGNKFGEPAIKHE